jgi:acetyltransferase-like isoleucine patch superfamily enzyme
MNILDRVRVRRAALERYRLERIAYTTERLQMGTGSYGDPLIPTYPGDTSWVRVGNFVSIALDVVLGDGGDHRIDWVSTYPFRARYGMEGAYADGHPRNRGDIVIGSDVWIGRGARVRCGVTVGDGAVIGSYSVVTRDVRPYAIVTGLPATEVRRRFSDEQVEALRRIAWWDWPLEEVLERVPRLCSDDVDEFIRRYG